MTWSFLPQDDARAMERLFLSWQETPYRPRHRIMGYGVDCINLAVVFLVHGGNTPQQPAAPDASPAALLRAFPVTRQERWALVETGDILVLDQLPGMAQAHLLVASPWPWHFFHATRPSGVLISSVSEATIQHHMRRHYRPARKDFAHDSLAHHIS